MEAASRPIAQPLTDLPVEEPLGTASPASAMRGSGSAAVGSDPATAGPAVAPGAAPEGLIDAEVLLGPEYSAARSIIGRPAMGFVAPAAPSPAASAEPRSVPATPAMDRDFIARNQIVERYLSGRLPVKGATDFERFCHEHPELLDELGLPERVNAGLRLLEASGKPEPWQVSPQPWWRKPQWAIGLAATVVALVITLAAVADSSASKSRKITQLQKQAIEKQLDPATSTRTIRLLPRRDGASNIPAVLIGGGAAELVDFRIDETRSAYKTFRITIDRIDQGRVAVLHNLTKDSNGHLRVALNSSALGPGNYQLTIEGLSWRGDPEPDSWITIGVQR